MLLKAFLSLSLLAPLALSAQTPSRLIQADVAQLKGPTNRMYNLCVGAGRANEGLRADWQRQLRQMKADCGFRYIRFHGLFCDDMGVLQIGRDGKPCYNWQYVDELFDFLQSIGMKPFVELGFMPSGLASGSQTIFWYRGNVTPPRDYALWQAFIKAFAAHITERYGREEVRTWYFEVWNEPNLTGFWIGDTKGLSYESFEPIARAEYFKLYESSVVALKSVDAAYRVGGPATAGEGWITETLNYAAEHQLPLDFISTHSYATMSGYLDETGTTGTVFSPDPGAITNGVLAVKAKIKASKLASVELHYTEWSSSYTPSDPLHDSYHSPAFILEKLHACEGVADSMSYWTFTDIFEEAGPRMTPFHGGFGLLNYQDLRKPSYFAFQFLNALGDEELVCQDPSARICRNGQGGLQALFWDFTITHPGGKVNNQEYYVGDHPPKDKGRTELRLSHVKPGRYRLQIRQVGYRANDVQAAWRDLGSPSQLTRAQVQELRQASSCKPILEDIVSVDETQLFVRQFELRENDVWLVELSPL